MINSYNRIREATRGKKYTYFCDHCAYAPADAARADMERAVLSNRTFKPDSTKLKLMNMNSVVMEGFISLEMKSSHLRKSGHCRLFQLALTIIQTN